LASHQADITFTVNIVNVPTAGFGTPESGSRASGADLAVGDTAHVSDAHPSPDAFGATAAANYALRIDITRLRWPALFVLAFGTARSHIPGEPGLACPLRALTGVPCPGCGMTTGVTQLLAADPMGALRANPYSIPFVLLCLVAVATFLPSRERQTTLRLPTTLRIPTLVVLAVLTSSWAFQLVRIF